MNLDTSNRTLRQLLGNGLIYSVPRFQRDYSWTSTEWDDLWQDIKALSEKGGETEHYMGYLVLQSADSKNFDVIDGQQRLTTLSILVLAVLGNLKDFVSKNIDEEQNTRRLEQLRSSFIGYLDPVSLVAKSKLNLNRNNNNLYQRYLVPLEPAPKRNLKATEHLMRKAYEWFYEKVRGDFAKKSSGEELARFIDSLSDKLFFTVITVNNELNAYKVFETLNARGVKLSSTDLLKNYLFSVVHNHDSDEHEIQELESRWEHLVGLIGNGSLPDFLRAYWNSKNRFVRQSELFKRIRDSINSKGQVFDLMRDLEMNAHVFAALPNSNDEIWNQEQSHYIKLLHMFNVRQLFPLLLSAYQNLDTKGFTSILRVCTIISFRYNVIGNLAPNEQERVYSRVAIEFNQHNNSSVNDILQNLKQLYVSDTNFRNLFAEKVLRTTQARNKKIARYILFEIEKHVSEVSYDFESGVYNLEHIMPESFGAAWEHISERDYEQFVFRIGNMTLLRSDTNRRIGNNAFAEKREEFRNSEFSITQRIANENNFWNPDRINEHQKWLANQATAIWRVSQFD
jgi:uncharacterized protein with ParB-like and HNH nuclease domain